MFTLILDFNELFSANVMTNIQGYGYINRRIPYTSIAIYICDLCQISVLTTVTIHAQNLTHLCRRNQTKCTEIFVVLIVSQRVKFNIRGNECAMLLPEMQVQLFIMH